ncbi:MAG: L-2-amino-thiazoline-4-carboxylic acid hydrolase [Erysipelotrichaceae bacterium]|nr:L-2-amino-thiazoline-4-carboxylic acid hydrolase [Erysipelotrichaceae bacterium]
MNMTLKDHALLYALLVKGLQETRKEEAEGYIAVFTRHYGHRRALRMKENAKALDREDLFGFLLCGELNMQGQENSSRMECKEKETVSRVAVCAWMQAWKRYDVVDYGSHYCRYIDAALAEVFSPAFSLQIDSTQGQGEKECVFRWDQSVNEKELQEARKEANGRYLKDYAFHCQDLLEAFRESLPDDLVREVLGRVKKDLRGYPEVSQDVSQILD